MNPLAEIRVAQVIDDETLVINKGSKDGITARDRFLVYEIGEEISDPVTKEPLGKLEIIKGTGAPIHIQERITTVRSDTVKSSQPKRIIRRPNPAFSGIGGFFNMTRDTVEEYEYGKELEPFKNDPKVGDLVKLTNRT
jgi:hypothetical protein